MEGARLPAGDRIYLHGRANTDRPAARYTQRIDIVVEDRGLNDVFLFLAQGIPLLDERLRTPRALLSENIKKREKGKKERRGERMREEGKTEWEGKRWLNKSMERSAERR